MVAVQVVPVWTVWPSAMDEVQVGVAGDAHADVDTFNDAVGDEFPAASRATTPNAYGVPQASPV